MVTSDLLRRVVEGARNISILSRGEGRWEVGKRRCITLNTIFRKKPGVSEVHEVG